MRLFLKENVSFIKEKRYDILNALIEKEESFSKYENSVLNC